MVSVLLSACVEKVLGLSYAGFCVNLWPWNNLPQLELLKLESYIYFLLCKKSKIIMFGNLLFLKLYSEIRGCSIHNYFYIKIRISNQPNFLYKIINVNQSLLDSISSQKYLDLSHVINSC